MAKLGMGLVKGVLLAVILTVILFTVINDTAADVENAAGNLSASGGAADNTYPLMSFFQKKGVLLLAFIAGIIIVLVTAYLSIGGKK